MGLFGKSFEEKVNEAIAKLRGQFPHAKLSAAINEKIVTLEGEAADIETKTQIMAAFTQLVETDNTINKITLLKPVAAPAPTSAVAPAAAPAAGSPDRFYEVVKGDTLSAISKQHYGNGNKYMRIFEANRDILSDPDKIQVGQKLTIPG